jgi:hypothetical protein
MMETGNQFEMICHCDAFDEFVRHHLMVLMWFCRRKPSALRCLVLVSHAQPCKPSVIMMWNA